MNLKMFCISLNPEHLKIIKNLNYIPVGLGKASFDSNWLTDKGVKEISYKNPYYGEYTFHYKIWKNDLIKDTEWIGFCQYRKFWKKDFEPINVDSFKDFNESILKKIPEEYSNYESIIGSDFFVNKFRFSKFVKHNLKKMIFDPQTIFFKSKRTIKFHFDMWHGDGNLQRAINLLEGEEKKDFEHYVNTEVSFSPHNMFICKNKYLLIKYYESLFPWLLNCEKIFGFKDLKSYGLKRIYGFLAERYLSYWFKKYTKFKILPIQFKDISDFL